MYTMRCMLFFFFFFFFLARLRGVLLFSFFLSDNGLQDGRYKGLCEWVGVRFTRIFEVIRIIVLYT